jgi:hypothetical protein
MATGSDRRSRDPEEVSLVGCVHPQPEVAEYPPYWGLFTGNNRSLPVAMLLVLLYYLYYNYGKKKARETEKKVREKIRACAEHFPVFVQKHFVLQL